MNYHDYIIVGAGPAGLQMGYYMEKANWDYLILEANEHAGAFFKTQPRQRRLLSINKRFNLFPEEEFNMRHDWNSLLTDDYSLLFRDYTEKLYPEADTLVQYLKDFAEKFALKIQYNTRVTHISREKEGDRLFILTDNQGNEYRCSKLIMGTGAVKHHVPDVEGIELAESYENYDMDLKRFENKRVAIIGSRNSAFEIANHIAGHAAIVHIWLGTNLIRHAWDSHFVGDLRAINNTFLDMFQLKSLHATLGLVLTKIVKLEDGTLRAYFDEHVPHWAVPGTLDGSLFYDIIIYSTGWHFVAPDIFADDIKPEVCDLKKYPVLNSSWESTTPDLFYIGTAMAARDKKAATSFIHGFRYNIRSLFRILEDRYHNAPLPSKVWPLTNGEELQAFIEGQIMRMSTTDALFQLFGVLCDVIVFSPGKAEIFHELPLDYVLENERFTSEENILIMTLEFGFDNYPKTITSLNFVHPNDAGDTRCGAFLHGVYRRYRYGEFVDQHTARGSVVVRYDQLADQFSGELTHHRPYNTLFNYVNKMIGLLDEELSAEYFYNNEERGGFKIWSPERRELERSRMGNLPICPYTKDRDIEEIMHRYQ